MIVSKSKFLTDDIVFFIYFKTYTKGQNEIILFKFEIKKKKGRGKKVEYVQDIKLLKIEEVH